VWMLCSRCLRWALLALQHHCRVSWMQTHSIEFIKDRRQIVKELQLSWYPVRHWVSVS
jgi:hypothetical protein